MVAEHRARPTLELVARTAGVSKATASKVLNHRPHVSPSTRERVEAAIKELGYVPSTGSREANSLREVHVVFNTVVNMYVMQVLDGVLAAASEHGVEVLVDSLALERRGPDGPLSESWLRHLSARGRAGVILVTAELTSDQRTLLRRLGIALVVVDPINPFDDKTPSVGATNFTGGVQATSHLLNLGHRRIGYAGGPPGSTASRERLHGFLSAMRAAGAPVDDRHVLETQFTFAAGLEMGSMMLSTPHRPTAVFAGSDRAALGIIEAARVQHLRVPQDLAIVGFDDTYATMPVAPALTTVRQPISDMGRVALRTLLQLDRGERPDSHHILLSTELVVRESTAAPGPAVGGPSDPDASAAVHCP